MVTKTVTPQKLVLTHNRAPGDIVVMTALVRDIMRAHPGRFQIDVETSAMDIWRGNPYITRFRKKKGPKPGIRYVQLDYGRGIRDQNYEPVHFLAYFHRDFERKMNVRVPLTEPYPDLHLSQAEKNVSPITGRYWVVISGGKSDFTTKVWEAAKMQEVCEMLGEIGLGAVQIGSTDSGHWHPPLKGDNVIDMVGRTNLRDMMRLIWHADGVICGVTCAMHMAAGLQKPCVCIAGGREAWWWEAYVRENPGLAPVADRLTVPHQFLHTIGLLDCCRHHGCWKNKVVAINKDKSLCYNPIIRPNQPVPMCMDMITPQHVLEAVMKYYENQTLPPITPVKQAETVKENTTDVPAMPPGPPPTTCASDKCCETKPAKTGRLLNLFDTPQPDSEKADELAKIQEEVAAAAAKKPGCKSKGNNGTNIKKKTSARLSLPKDHPLAQALANGKAKVGVNNGAKLEGRPNQDPNKKPAVAHAPGAPHPSVVTTDPAVFDHEDVGGKFTACILFYGPEEYYPMHKQCLESFLATTPRDRVDLRVGSNALNAKSVAMIEEYVKQGVITKHYQHKNNAFKYPVMREMFFDKDHPITTKWVLWFDDDSMCNRLPAWLNILAQHIIQYHRRDNAHMFGAPFVWTLVGQQKQWFESRPWYKGKPWRLHNGEPSPSGNKIRFCTGGFWAITHEAIVKADIPDPEIGHNGGDITIGEQLYQAGFNMKSWNAKKQFVFTSSVKRRGETKPMPGTTGHAQVIPNLIRVD